MQCPRCNENRPTHLLHLRDDFFVCRTCAKIFRVKEVRERLAIYVISPDGYGLLYRLWRKRDGTLAVYLTRRWESSMRFNRESGARMIQILRSRFPENEYRLMTDEEWRLFLAGTTLSKIGGE